MANEQRAARGKHDHPRLLLQRVMESVGCHLEPRRVALEGGGVVRIDGIDRDESILVEIFADRGQLKGPQRRRLSQHALKLITLGRTRPAARLIVAVADADVARAARQDGWLAQALASWGVEVLLVDPARPAVAASPPPAPEREPKSAPAAVAAESAPEPAPVLTIIHAEPAPDPEPEPAVLAAEPARDPEPEPAVLAAEPAPGPEPEPAVLAAEPAATPAPAGPPTVIVAEPDSNPAPGPEPEPEAEPAPAVIAPQPDVTSEPAPKPNPSTNPNPDPDPADHPDSPKRRRLIRLWSKNPGDFR
jgi:hypothetical protein